MSPRSTYQTEGRANRRLAYEGTSSSGRAAAAELLGWHDRLVRRLRAFGAHVLEVEPRLLTVDLINRYLEIKVRHLL